MRISRFGFMLVATVVAAGTAVAQCPGTPTSTPSGTNNFCLTGAGNGNSLDGIYVSPYTATINGVSSYVICDDFYSDVDINESWTVPVSGYNVTQAATGTPTSGLFGTNPPPPTALISGQTSAAATMGYEEVAWLSQQLMMNLPTLTAAQQDTLSYSIWAVFDPNGVQSYLSGYSGGASFYSSLVAPEVSAAHAAVTSAGFSVSSLSDVTIYTPLSGETCCSIPAQEFVVVNAAEAPSSATLGIDFLGLGVLLFVFQRKRFAVR